MNSNTQNVQDKPSASGAQNWKKSYSDLSRQETAEFDGTTPHESTPQNTEKSYFRHLPPKTTNQDQQPIKRPPRQPWNNTTATIETSNILRRENITKQIDVSSSLASTRAASFDNRRYTRTPDKKPQLQIDIPKFSTDQKSVADARARYHPSRETSRSRNQERGPTVVLAKNKEVEMKHDLAQNIIELINQNEKMLVESDSKLSSYLNQSLANSKPSCMSLVDSMRKQYNQRLQNLSKIFELIELRRGPSASQDLLETVYQTPKSLCKTIDFSN